MEILPEQSLWCRKSGFGSRFRVNEPFIAIGMTHVGEVKIFIAWRRLSFMSLMQGFVV